MNDKYLTVSALTRYLKVKFDLDDNLKSVFLKGEISNFKAHTAGHFYFSIKDEGSKINAIMFRSNASKIDFTPADGTKVLVCGHISIYEPTGGYQIYVDSMLQDGVGNLYVAYEKLKKKLMTEGYFDEAHKKKIPKVPKRVGIVTASTGAAVRDIITTIRRRFPICETILFPTLVQGDNAKDSIAFNIQRAQDYDLDVLIVGRGGGSIEDLWPFNEEIVDRAIYNSKVPVISAVGHEVDFTIADFVADLRAPTPTAAAELAVPNMADLKKHISQIEIRLNESIYKKINYLKLYLDSIKNSFVLKSPMLMYENKKQVLDLLGQRLNESILKLIKERKDKLILIKTSYVLKCPQNIYDDKFKLVLDLKGKINSLIYNKVLLFRHKFDMIKTSYILKNPHSIYKDSVVKLIGITDKLSLLNPLNVLSRGFSITYLNDKVLKNVKDVQKDDVLKIKMKNGTLNAKVMEVYNGEEI